jgi:hypothetical protein
VGTPLLPTPFFFPLPPLFFLNFFFFSYFLVFPTSPIAPAIHLLMLHCLPPSSTMLHRSLLPRIGWTLYLASSTSFAQLSADPPCSWSPQLPIGAKQLHLFHHVPTSALHLPCPSYCSCLLIFLVFCENKSLEYKLPMY